MSDPTTAHEWTDGETGREFLARVVGIDVKGLDGTWLSYADAHAMRRAAARELVRLAAELSSLRSRNEELESAIAGLVEFARHTDECREAQIAAQESACSCGVLAELHRAAALAASKPEAPKGDANE